MDIVSFLLGIVTSFIAWLLVFHFFVPKVNFSEKISKQVDSNSNFKYRIKIENAGARSIYELNIYVKISIRGLNIERKRNLEVTFLPVSFEGVIPIIEPVKKTRRRNLIKIDPNKTEEFERDIYPYKVRNKVKNKQLLLEDLLSLGSEAWLELYIIGNDQFSGSRKVITSKKYFKQDIVDKPFDKNSLEIKT